jgi:hypothetical protein
MPFYRQGSGGGGSCLRREGSAARWGTRTVRRAGTRLGSGATGETSADAGVTAHGVLRPPTKGGARDRGTTLSIRA